MSLFSLFGPAIKYSQHEHALPELELKKLLMHVHHVPGATVSEADRDLVLEAIETRRGGDGKISLQQIYEVLHKFKLANKITKYDEAALMKAFEEYFAEHFSE